MKRLVIAAPVWRTRAKLSHALVAVGIGNALKRAGASGAPGRHAVCRAHVVESTLRRSITMICCRTSTRLRHGILVAGY